MEGLGALHLHAVEHQHSHAFQRSDFCKPLGTRGAALARVGTVQVEHEVLGWLLAALFPMSIRKHLSTPRPPCLGERFRIHGWQPTARKLLNEG